MKHMITLMVGATLMAIDTDAAPAAKLAAERALLKRLEIQPSQLKPLRLDTVVVAGGEPRAVICHADSPAWCAAAEQIREAIAQATGIHIPATTDTALDGAEAWGTNTILLGHLDNNRHVARLYHNFFACLDTGFTGRRGYVIRSVHDPFGTGHNALLVGGSFPEGTALAAEALSEKVRQAAQPGALTFGRMLELVLDPTDRQEPHEAPLTDERRDAAVASARKAMFSPGQGRNGVARMVEHAVKYHRTGDIRQAEAYRELILAMIGYYETDDYINEEGLARYDRDFRDAWTHSVCVTWDLLEETGLFSDAERLAVTNHVLRLGLECVLYQRYDTPERVAQWAANTDIVHNHNTFPALGVYFVGHYLERHYGVTFVDDWIKVAHGIFNGQKRSSKPLEDAAAYQWLPLIHTAIYSLAEGDLTFFEEGHLREAAQVAQMTMDNSGCQAAFGDHSGYRASGGIGTTLQRAAWYYRDPQLLGGAHKAVGGVQEHVSLHLGQPYFVDLTPETPSSHRGLRVSFLPKKCYDYAARSPQYATAPNLPWERTFDKMAFRAGLEREDGYLLLDGFGRGTHMHFDANAIIRFAAGGEPLLVDGEYIKNAPKYHSSLVILRDGQSQLTPAVTGLHRADSLRDIAFSDTYLTDYNGTEWHRRILWNGNDYFLVFDTVEARTEGSFTLRCCWRPWGEATLEGGVLTVSHPPMTMQILNADDASCRLETMKVSERMPISRLSQQVSRRMDAGDSYTFINLVHAEPADSAQPVRVRRIGPSAVAVQNGDLSELVALNPGDGLPGLSTDAEMVLLSPDAFAVSGCTRLKARQLALEASLAISLELDGATGTGVICAGEAADVRLAFGPAVTIRLADTTHRADANGVVTFPIPAGRHELSATSLAIPAPLRDVLGKALALPDYAPRTTVAAADTPALPQVWEYAGFDPVPEVLPLESVVCAEPHHGRYGPVKKLADGECSGSPYSVMWPEGVTPTITLTLPSELVVSAVVLREWHMFKGWDIGSRRLEISSDGFRKDVRAIAASFREAGLQQWGNNVNTLMRAEVKQRAQQLRLTIAPARDDSSVYVAEVEVLGTRPGKRPQITALTTGRITDAGQAIVAASDSGAVKALDSTGRVLWDFQPQTIAAVNSVACADVNGDGRDEVICGLNGACLRLLASDGKPLWEVRPPEFRGIPPDVMTVFPADVNGDGQPEIICGCKNWLYCAYDAQGQLLWRNVIYAHSATVGCAADFDGDGLAEVVGGNAYYTLNLIDHDGKRIFSRDRLGPEQTAAAAVDVDGDGKPEIVIGTDGGELICFNAQGRRIWTANVGDKVTRILPDEPGNGKEPTIVCAAESAHVFGVGSDGRLLWRCALADGVHDLAAPGWPGTPYVAAAGSAGVVAIDARGRIIATGATPEPALTLAMAGDIVVATTGRGRLIALERP